MQRFWEAWSRQWFTLTLPRLVLDERRSRQPGRICLGTLSVPETGRKHAVLQLTVPNQLLPSKKGKRIIKGHIFLVCWWGKENLGLKKLSSTPRQNRKPKQNLSNAVAGKTRLWAAAADKTGQTTSTLTRSMALSGESFGNGTTLSSCWLTPR